jgi:hypothetical protein
MQEDDLSYSRRRAEEEAARAMSIGSPQIAIIHRQMAEAYRERVTQLSTVPGRLAAPWPLSV